MAVEDAIHQTVSNGESVLEQIQGAAPHVHDLAREYWERETARKVGTEFKQPAKTEVPTAPHPAAEPAQPGAAPVGVWTPPVERPAAVEPAPAEAPPAPSPEPATPAEPAPEITRRTQPVHGEPRPVFQLNANQQAVLNALPENQRAKALAAFEADRIADPHNEKLAKYANPMDPSKSPALAELSKYGALDDDASVKSVLERVAADKNQPRWLRSITDLINQLGGHENVSIEIVNLPNANWPALYKDFGGGRPGKIYFNLAMPLPAGGVARSLAHEMLHHLTMVKLMGKVPLNAVQSKARSELIGIFDMIKEHPDFRGEYATHSTVEMVSEIFSNERLRAKLNQLDPKTKQNIFMRILNALARLFTGDDVKPGSLLEEAMRQTINVAGVRAAREGPSTAAMNRQDQARLLHVLNEFPEFHDEIVNASAPMRADMKIEAKKRTLDPENAWYSDTERDDLESKLDEALKEKGWKLSKDERAKFSQIMETRVKALRTLFPKIDNWATDMIKPTGVELKETKTKGRVPEVQFEAAQYTFDKDAQGNYLTRYVDQNGNPITRIANYLKRGEPLTENPEWEKRVEDMASVGVDKLMDLINSDDKELSDTILAQIGWYKEMVHHLRHSYGGMSDLMADLLGTFSPMTGMKENWSYGVQALGKVMKGDYDELLGRVDKWMKEDPSRTIEGWKKLHGEKGMIVKENGKLFGQNSIHGMKALLDFWRIVQSGSAPKARNFTLNLIGNSYKATIDVWAARFLQRMHNPNYRIPTIVESDVPGEHMAGELVEKVDKGFGMGQDVFQRMVDKMQKADPEKFRDMSAADLQAIMWFLEKSVWEKEGWTRVQGAANSARALAAAEGIGRYEVGLSQDAKKQKAYGAKLHGKLASIPGSFAAKVMDTLTLNKKGASTRAFDTEQLVRPEFNPEHLLNHVLQAAGEGEQDHAMVARVLPEGEENPNARPGMTVFLKEQVSLKDLEPIMAELKKLGMGVTLQVDPRAKEELRPEVKANGNPDRFNGVRIQFIPELVKGAKADSRTMNDAMVAAKKVLQDHGNVSYIGSYSYDTLVLKKGEYDSSGNVTGTAANSRREAWLQRARDAHDQARSRRDEAKALIDANTAEAKRLKAEADLADEQQLAEISGRIEKGVTAAQAQEHVGEESIIDPNTGRPSMVRALANREANAGGAGFPEGSLSQAGLRHLRSGATPRGGRGPALWEAVGGPFRRRAAELHQSFKRAGQTLQALVPGNENRYKRSQELFDLLTHPDKEVTDPELAAEVENLREQVPVLDLDKFIQHPQLRSGKEARVHHDKDGRVVYKLFRMQEGKIGAYVPGKMSLDADKNIRLSMGRKPSLIDFMNRMNNVNQHGKLTPMELVGVTPEGFAVVAQPFVVGKRVTGDDIHPALNSVNMKVLTQFGGTGAIGKVGDKWVVWDDLHHDNMRALPGGRTEVFDAINRDLTPDEVDDLRTLGHIPEEQAEVTVAREGEPLKVGKVTHFDNASVTAPIVDTHHGTQHEWEPEVKVRHLDGSEEWIRAKEGLPLGAQIIERAPAGRVRKEFVLTGEGHAAFGWGVNYSAQNRGLAEHYRDTLTEGHDPRQAIVEAINNAHYAIQYAANPKPDRAELQNFLSKMKGAKQFVNQPEIMDLVQKISDGLDTKTDTYSPSGMQAFKQLDRMMGPPPKGNVYGLRLDVNDPELLNWFRPMTDQMWIFNKVMEHFGVTHDSAQAAYEEGYRITDETLDLQERVRDREKDYVINGRKPADLEELTTALTESKARWESHSRIPAYKFGQMLQGIEGHGIWEDLTKKGKSFSGEDFYDLLSDLMDFSPRKASELMDSAGVPGIVFLDRESRKLPGVEAVQSMIANLERRAAAAGGHSEWSRNEIRRLQDLLAKPRTNNYVIFDPERIKVISKNGEPVMSMADAIEQEGVSAAQTQEDGNVLRSEPVQDGTDVVSAPLAPRGRFTRFMTSISDFKAIKEKLLGEQEGTYKTEGLLRAGGGFNDKIQNALQTKVQNGKEIALRATYLTKEFEAAVLSEFGGVLNPAQLHQINLALGNLDNRLTPQQAKHAKLIRDAKLRAQYIDQAERDNIYRFKQAQTTALNNLPAPVRDAIVKMNDHIQLMNATLLRDADISPDLKQAISKNIGTYLHRSYQIFEDNDVWKNRLLDAQKNGDTEAIKILNDAKALFHGYVLKQKVHEYATAMVKAGTPKTYAQALNYANSLNIDHDVENMLADYMNIGDDPVAGKISLMGARGREPLGRRSCRNGARSMRRSGNCGEWKDPVVNFAKTYTSLGAYAQNDAFQRQVLTDGLAQGYIWKQGVSTGPRPAGFVQIIPEGSKTMKVLADTYGPQLLHSAFSTMNSPAQKAGLDHYLAQAMALPLAAKTVGSIGAAARNYLGNLAFITGNGNQFFFGFHKKAFQSALEEATKSGNRQDLVDYVLKLTKLGVFGDNVDVNMVRKIMQEKTGEGGASMLDKMLDTLPDHARGPVKKFAAFFPSVYTAADSYWKSYAFEAEMAKLKWAHADELDALTGPAKEARIGELEKDAAKIVRRTLPTYSEAWSLLDETKTVGRFIAPFIKFKTEVMRVAVGTIKQGLEEVKSTNPKIKKVGVWRLASAAMTALAPAIIAYATKAAFGYDDDDEETIRGSLPDWQKDNNLMFLPKDKDGKPRFLDFSYMNPFNILQDPETAAIRSIGHDPEHSLTNAAMVGFVQAVKPFISEQLWLATVSDIFRNEDSSKNNQPLWNTEGTTGEMISAWGDRAARAVRPGTWDAMERIGKGVRGEVSGSGRAYDPGNEAMALVGMRVTTIDPPQALQTMTSDFKQNMGKADKLFLQPFTNRGTIEQGEVTKRYNQTNEARKALFYKMRQNYLGSVHLGMTAPQAIHTMMIGFGSDISKAGIGKDDIGLIISGKYQRYRPSKPALMEARSTHPERYQEFINAFNAAPDFEDISAQ
jgi:hypothetical protein